MSALPVGPLEPESLPLSLVQKDRIMEAHVSTLRFQLHTQVVQNTDTETSTQLLMSHASIKQRYKILNFPQLLQANSQSLVELQRLNVALAILEKYGRHLMRPLSLRSAQWATIKFINPIFAEKVDIVQGGRDIMAKLGYSVDLGDGLSYPEGVEPDPQHLSIIVADIVLAQQEIHKLISRQHPTAEGLNSYLSERCLYEIAYSTGANVGYPASAMPAQPAVSQQQPYSMRPSPAIPPLRLKPNLALSLASSQLSSSSSDCEICGEKSPDMVCTICNSKQLCRSCDEKWHKHPRRQNHHRTHLKHETLSSRQPTQPKQWPQSGSSLANPVAGYMSASPGVWQPVSMPPAVPEVLRVHNGPGDDKPPSLLNAPQSQPDSGDSPSSDDSFHSTEESSPQTTLHGYPPPLPDAFRTDSYKSPITVLSRELAAIKDSRQEKKKELNAIIGSSDAFQENELYQKLTRESDQLLRKKLVLERKIKELELNNISLLPEKVYLPPPSQNMSAKSDSLLPPTRSAEVNPEPNFELGTNLPHRNGKNVNAHNTLPNLRTLDMKHIQVGKASATLPKPNFRQQVVQSLETQEELQQFDSGKLVLAEIGVGDSNQRKQRRGREFMRQWHCEHCTVINPPGGNICSVCHKTSDNPRLVQQEASADGALKEGAPAEGAIRGTVTSIDTSIHSGSSFGERTRHVFEEAEEIQAQKEEARRKLALMMKEEEIKQQQPQQDLDETENIADADRGAECQLDDWTMLNNPRAKCAVSATKPCLSTKVIDHIQEKSKTTNAEKSSTKGNNLKLDVALASQNREAENGKRVVQFLREVSDHGFEPAELQLALQKCGAEQNPFDWLRQSLQTVINTVVTLVTNEGAKLDENDVGEISATEAKRKLLEMNGDVDKTVKACVRERRKKVQTVMADGPFSRESALEALLRYNGDVNAATSHLQAPKMKPFAERIWEEPVEDQREAAVPCANPNPDYQFVANSITDRKDFEQTVKNSSICVQRRTRMVFVEGRLRSWGRAQVVLKILTEHKEFSLKDVIEAVQNCGDVRGSLAFLQQDCEICFTSVPMSKIRNFTLCQCKLCVECISQHLEFNIREKFVKDWSCPICNKPDVQQELSDAEEHFSFVDMLLQTLLGREIRELFQDKLRDWRLMQDPNFRWCAHCGNGFIFNGFALKMECASCQRFTCFKCKKPWESQHEGLTCEQFEQWRVDNNPENQATGLARHLDTNGIVCPSCKMRYVLAKGGCMHFTCPQCGHEFCCGCHLPFRRAENCKRYQSCRNQGLHCHHPRDCFFYLRDNSVEELQSLLEKHKVEFNKDAPNGQENTDTCAVMEQKEVANQRRDEACGRDVVAGHAGLCQIHYKEYLVDLINKHGIDPVILLSVDDIKNLLIKMEMEVPSVNRNETSRNYHKRLRQFVQQEIPLQRKNSSGQT